MADVALGFLLENLKQLALYQYNLKANAKSELDLLKKELEVMKAFLEVNSGNPRKDELFRVWESQIRDTVYEAEDTIDLCVAAPKSKIPFKGKRSPSLAEEVQSLRKNKVKPAFEKAFSDFAKLPIADTPDTSAEHTMDRRIKPPRKDNVVGFQDETKTLIKFITEDTETLDVVSIIGMPGLGKTTVAWKIFNDPGIQFEFPTRIWVYVSQELNKRDVFITILKKFTNKEDMSSKHIDELIAMVHGYLEKEKFLIVMDDVWSNDAWNELQEVLSKSNNKGKVLITSRDENVAWFANSRRKPHKLRFLSPSESWELLQLEVFGKVNNFPSELEVVGKRIAGQCDGLPLAIIVIGGILVGKFSTPGGNSALIKEWEKVSEDSVEVCLMYEDKERRMEKMISLSYNKLPYHLKDCFLYLGMFPEDTEILAWKLIQLWIAEGFVQLKPNKNFEEVAHDNLKDLINRNLVMVDKIKPNGEVKTCRVHDTIREFCKNEASVGKQNLFQEIKMSKQGVFQPPLLNVPKYRRLCIHSYVKDFLLRQIQVPNTRSFLCFSKEPIILDAKDIAFVIKPFNLVRVFDISTIKFPKFPSKIMDLVHLRYMTLTSDDLKVLPEAISKLWNLQTLTVDTQSRTLDVSADIWALMQLRHFKTKAAIVLLNKGKGEGGEHLQTLSRLSPRSCTNEVLTKAGNINTLGIRGDLEKVLESKVLKKLQRLKKLKLVHDMFPKVASENPLQGLPCSDTFPSHLKFLTLSATYLEWRNMFTLGQIDTLEVLKLKDYAFIGDSWNSTAGGFRRLQFFYISRTDLKFWNATTDAFPVLTSLVLKNCENLEAVPLNLGNKLEMLYIERVLESVAVSAREIEKKKLEGKEQYIVGMGGFKLIIAPGVERSRT